MDIASLCAFGLIHHQLQLQQSVCMPDFEIVIIVLSHANFKKDHVTLSTARVDRDSQNLQKD